MARTNELLTALATVGCAMSIGFVMQSSEAAERRYGNVPAEFTDRADETMERSNAVLEVQDITLTSAEFKLDVEQHIVVEAQVTKASTTESLVEPEIVDAPVVPSCKINANARPVAAAMVTLSLSAPCLPEERVTVHHNGMVFSDLTSADGVLEVTVPALKSDAVFIFAFTNGEGAVAQTAVEELEDYDRVVLQWKGATGFELHALEFGAEYGSSGHIWQGAPGEVADAVTGSSGIITRHGDDMVNEALIAEVYTFPKSATDRAGAIALSVEAEVTDMNCGLELEAQTLERSGAGAVETRNVILSVPDCDTRGDFLVLNNLFQDLKVAAK